MIGDRVRERRDELGINQVELGRGLGVTQQTVARHEKMEILTLPVIAELEDALEMRRGDLLRRSGHVAPVESVRQALETDTSLDEVSRRFMLDAYDVAVMQSAGRRTDEPSDPTDHD